MRGRMWGAPFCCSLIIHLVILIALGYAVIGEGPKQEVQYVEVTMAELFSPPSDNQPPGGGGGGNSAKQSPNIPPIATPFDAARSPQNAANMADVPVFSGSNFPTFSSGGDTGGSYGGSGSGTG
ncbi:MAG TPA: hypothetical protein VN462_07445, partial [Negativicutes bacterium]|nr:hypothetical protein [Negativicutes bacterium]